MIVRWPVDLEGWGEDSDRDHQDDTEQRPNETTSKRSNEASMTSGWMVPVTQCRAHPAAPHRPSQVRSRNADDNWNRNPHDDQENLGRKRESSEPAC